MEHHTPPHYPQPQHPQYYEPPGKGYAIAALALGIIGAGSFALVLGIIGIFLSRKSDQIQEEAGLPRLSESKVGMITSIVATALGGLFILSYISMFAIYGAMIFAMFASVVATA